DIEYEADHGVPLHAGAIARRPVARDADAGAHIPAAAHHRSDLLLPSAHTDADRAADHPADAAADLHPHGNTRAHATADHHPDSAADLLPDADAVAASH